MQVKSHSSRVAKKQGNIKENRATSCNIIIAINYNVGEITIFFLGETRVGVDPVLQDQGGLLPGLLHQLHQTLTLLSS